MADDTQDRQASEAAVKDAEKLDREEDKTREKAGVATHKANHALEHSQGGKTTRSDRTDVGVPMLAGDPGEPVGPEDALGAGDKRGDYSQRIGGSDHFESVPVEGGGEPVYGPDGQVVDVTPSSRLVHQTPRAGQVGEVPKAKGGVNSAQGG